MGHGLRACITASVCVCVETSGGCKPALADLNSIRRHSHSYRRTQPAVGCARLWLRLGARHRGSATGGLGVNPRMVATDEAEAADAQNQSALTLGSQTPRRTSFSSSPKEASQCCRANLHCCCCSPIVSHKSSGT